MRNQYFCAFMLVLFVLVVPVQSMAITYNQFMALTSGGRTKVATSGVEFALRYGLARRALGFTGAIGGTVVLAMTLFDAYNAYTDHTQVSATIPTAAATTKLLAEGQFDTGAWGVSSSASCAHYWHTHMSDPCVENGRWSGGFTSWEDEGGMCSFATNPAYIQVGGKSYFTTSTYQAWSSCQPDAVQGDPVVYKTRSVILTYYATKTSYTPVVVVDDTAEPFEAGSTAATNTDTMLAYIAAAQRACNAYNASIVAGGQGGEYGGMSEVCKLFNSTNQTPHVVPVDTPADYNPQPGSEPEPGPDPREGPIIPPPGSDDPPEPGPPPPTSDGTCSDYVPENDWASVSADITAALASVPMFALLDKLSDIGPGESGTPHTFVFEMPYFGGSPLTLDLDEWYFEEMITLLRWMILAGAFYMAWRIAMSGE